MIDYIILLINKRFFPRERVPDVHSVSRLPLQAQLYLPHTPQGGTEVHVVVFQTRLYRSHPVIVLPTSL